MRTICGSTKSKYALIKVFTTLNGINTGPNLGNDTIIYKCKGVTTSIINVYNTSPYNKVVWSTNTPGTVDAGDYTLIVGNPYGEDTVVIAVRDYPKPSIGNDTTVYICSGNARSLRNVYDTTPYFSVKYSTPRPDVALTGTYSIIVTNQYGCADTANITVLQETSFVPVVTASGSLRFCNGDSINLTVSGSNFILYNWNNGYVGNPLVVKNSGFYKVTVTNNHGCTSSSSVITVVTQEPPKPVITDNVGGVRSLCPGIIVTLTSSATKNIWSTGEITQSINVDTTGNYAVKTYDNLGCSASNYKPVSYRLCSPPSLYFASVTNNFSAKVYWTVMPCALSYDISYRAVGSSNFTTINVTDTFAMLTNLLSNTKYEWKVRVVCASGPGIYNNAKTFVTASSTKSVYARQNESGTVGNDNFSVSIFPNPAKTFALLKVNSFGLPLSVSISSADGKEIWQSKKIISNQINIPVADYEASVYFVTVQNGKEVKTVRLMVEK